ncbi:TPA: hypothetical protein ACRMWJ_005965 [Pseudomonas aeruginosa]
MRFKQMPRYGEYKFSDRKRRAFARKLVKEQERFPLLAAQIEGEQHSVEEEQQFRLTRMRASEARMRKVHADTWRRVRAMYFALSSSDREVVQEKWRRWSGPADPVCLSYIIRVHTGEYDALTVAQKAESAALRASLRVPYQDTLPL